MIVYCGNCGGKLREGEEVKGTFHAYYHELGSKVHWSITKPHDYDTGTLCHSDCLAE